MDSSLLGLIFLFGTIFLARRMQQKAISYLSDEQKVQLIELGSARNTKQMALIIGLFIGYMVLTLTNLFPFIWTSVLFFSLLAMVSGYRFYKQFSTYKQLHFPDDYLSAYKVSNLITITGIVIYAVLRLTVMDEVF